MLHLVSEEQEEEENFVITSFKTAEISHFAALLVSFHWLH